MNKKDIKAFIELQRMKTEQESDPIRNVSDTELSFNEIADEKLNNTISNEIDKKLALNEEEANLMLSALDMREKKVEDVMIPLEKVFTIDYDEVINEQKLKEIIQKGYSRIPVFSFNNQNDLIGIVRIKQLLGLNFEKNKSLSDLNIKIRKPIVVHPNIPIIDLLKLFLNGRSHMAFITDNVEKIQYCYGLDRNNSIMDMNDIQNFRRRNISSNSSILGIVTLEDVIEHIYGIKINDEDDYDNEKKQKMKLKNQSKNLHGISGNRDNLRISYGNPFDDKKNFLIDDLPYNNSSNKLDNNIII
jgi:metal transporter CNNM